MLHLELTEEEHAALREVLESDLPDLRVEISETDRREFKEQLKKKEQLLSEILNKLQ